jgi:ectoine hydroxylase-related dioxygenase (phytanoyl-CoA dioxygenase family)
MTKNKRKKEAKIAAPATAVVAPVAVVLHETRSNSLVCDIFGNSSQKGKEELQCDLFARSDEFQQACQKRIKENTDCMVSKCGAASIGSTSLQSVLTDSARNDILHSRKERLQRPDVIQHVDTIAINVPYLGVVNDCEDEEEQGEIIRGQLRMFTFKCDAAMREQGVLIIRSKEGVKNSRLIDKNLLEKLRLKAATIESEICTKLKEKGHSFQTKENTTENFKYHEVASRGLGRLDIRYHMDASPFNDDEVVCNRYLRPVINSLLGDDSKLVYAGLILSFPDSCDQPWHMDGTTLFSDCEFPMDHMLPPYALNVFIPLTDISEEVGPTEFCVGSHCRKRCIDAMKCLEKGDEKGAQVIGPLLKAGDALIYDYRTCHRGTRNLSRDKTRPMLYLMYARPWFREHINFSKDKLFG